MRGLVLFVCLSLDTYIFAGEPRFSVIDLLDMRDEEKYEAIEKLLEEPRPEENQTLIELLGEEEKLDPTLRGRILQALSVRLTEEDFEDVLALAEREDTVASVCGILLLAHTHNEGALEALRKFAKADRTRSLPAIYSFPEIVSEGSLNALRGVEASTPQERSAVEWAKWLLELRLGRRKVDLRPPPAIVGSIGFRRVPRWLGAFRIKALKLEKPSDCEKLFEGKYSAWLLLVNASEEREIFGSQEFKKALRLVLERGGKVYISGQMKSIKLIGSLREVGVAVPQGFRASPSTELVPRLYELHPVLFYPTDLAATGEMITANGSWEKWGEAQVAPFCPKASPQGASLVIQEGARGRGSVVFSLVSLNMPRLQDNFRCYLLPPELERDFTSYYEISEETETPHYVWAKPLARPISVLFLFPEGRDYYGRPLKRLPVELHQRLSIEYNFAPIRERLIDLVKSKMMPLNLTRLILDNTLYKDYEVIVLGNAQGIYGDENAPYIRAWVLLTPEVKRSILKKVYEGTCLILTGDSGLLSSAIKDLRLKFKSLPDWLACTIPKPPRSLQADYGRGKVVILFGGGKEEWYAFLCRVMLWGSGRLDSAFIRTARITQVDYRGSEKGIAIQTSRQIEKLTALYLGEEERSVENGLEIPPLPEGQYRVYLRALAKDGTIDFIIKRLTVTAPTRVDAIKLEKDYCLKGEKVRGEASLQGRLDKVTLHTKIIDSAGRLIFQKRLEPRENLSFEFPVEYPLVAYHEVVFELRDKEGFLLSRKRAPFAVHLPYDTHRMQWILWGGNGTPYLRGKLGIDGFQGTLEDLRYGTWCLAIARGPSVGQPKGSKGIRTPSLSRPSFREAYRMYMEGAVEKWAETAVRCVLLEDECNHGAFGYAPSALIQFRTRLKKTYGSLERLNATWGTNFKRWGDVMPMRMEEAVEHGNLAPWMDHMEFVDWVYSDWLDLAESVMRERIPDGRIGLSSYIRPELPGGADPWKMSRSLGFVILHRGFPYDYIRSFARPDLIWGVWVGAPYSHSDKLEGRCRWEIWENLFRGANALGHFASWLFFRSDLSPHNTTRWTKEEMDEIRRGIDHLVLGSERDNRGIAIYYSQSSWRITYPLRGKVPPYAPGGYKRLLRRLYLSYDLITPDQLLTGKVRYPDYRILILPTTLVLSTQEARAMEKFVSGGGCLVADFFPALYNEHGIPYAGSPLSKLFGVDLKLLPLAKKGNLTSEVMTGEVRLYAKGIRSTTAQPLGRIGTEPAILRNDFGKGKAFLLNFHPAGLKQGEKILDYLLREAGVEKPFQVSGESERVRFYHFLRGETELVGLSSLGDPVTINYDIKKKIQLRFPKKWHIYDVRRAKYLGYTDLLDIEHIPSIAQLFSLLPAKPSGVQIRAGSVHRGTLLRLSAKLLAQPTLTRPVFRVQLYSPDGTHQRAYDRILEADGAEAKARFPISLNAPLGRWKVRVVEIASGLSEEVTFRVTEK